MPELTLVGTEDQAGCISEGWIDNSLAVIAHYADIVVGLPAICEVCKQEIAQQIWIANGHTYCYEHAPEYKEDECQLQQ